MKNIFVLGDIVKSLHDRISEKIDIRIEHICSDQGTCNYWKRDTTIECTNCNNICQINYVTFIRDGVVDNDRHTISNCDVMYKLAIVKPNITEFGQMINKIYVELKEGK